MQAGLQEEVPPPPSGPQVQSVQHVLQTIQGVLSIDPNIRHQAEALLKAWEADAVPGFLISLLQIVEQSGAIDEAIRLLAAVVAKNAVGSSWRKTLGSREWSRVPAEEQQAVRDAAFRLLLCDPSDRVSTQLCLLLSNIARFDFPGRAPDLLQQLIAAAQWPPTTDAPPPMHLRALKALHQVLVALTTKRFVVEAPRPGAGKSDLAHSLLNLRALGASIAQERELYNTKLSEAAAPLTQLFLTHAQAFLGGVPHWHHHAAHAKAAATCLADRLHLAPQAADQLPVRAEELLNACHSTLSAIMAGPPAGALDPAAAAMWQDLGGKVYERVCRVVISHLDIHPLAFASFVAPFLQLFVGGALLSADASTIHRMRPKRRVLLVRFIAKALLSPFYRSEWTQAPLPPAVSMTQREQLQANRGRALVAQQALESLIGPAPDQQPEGPVLPSQQCAHLLEAVIAKYIVLTQDELQEWQDDAESYARSMEVESGPDAETPRPIGVGLLLCMLERGGEPVVQALLQLAARMQQAQGPEAALLREASYRCIGEGFNHVSPHIQFSGWYAQELQPMLSNRLQMFQQGAQSVIDSVLQARTLWLVGVCSSELRPEDWGKAFGLAAGHMAAQDLVVALTAVSSCSAMCAPLLDEQGILEQAEAAERRAAKSAAGASGLVAALHLSDRDKEPAAAAAAAGYDLQEEEQQAHLMLTRQRVDTRLEAIAACAAPALQAAFGLLTRLTEVESMVRVLQLISVLVEVMDVRIKPHLPIIAAALPQIWEAAAQHMQASAQARAAASGLLASASNKKDTSNQDTGAVVRLHSALLAVLTHLVGKLKGSALADPQIAGVVYPLLRYATSLGSQESECLVDEAFRLWTCTLSSLPEVPPAVIELLPNLAALLKRGRDAPSTFPLVEAYLLLGAAPSVIPMLDLIQQAMIACVHGVEKAALASFAAPSQDGAALPGAAAPAGAQQSRAFSMESSAEALAASALADVMLQLSPQEVPTMLAPTFAAMVHFVVQPQLPSLEGDSRLANCLEGFLEVLARVFLVHPPSFASLIQAAATAGSPEQPPLTQDPKTLTSLFIDKWLTIASHTYIEERLGVKTMSMLGRYRRRIATSALCALMAANCFPQVLLESPSQIIRVANLAVRVQIDDREFHADQSELDNLDFKGDLAEDRVLAKRLQVTRNDPVRTLKAYESVHALLSSLAAAAGGPQHLLTLLAANASPRLAAHVNAILTGSLDSLREVDSEGDDRGFSGAGDEDEEFGGGVSE